MCYSYNKEIMIQYFIYLFNVNLIGFPLITGVLAAMLHVLSGPDHLAAVAPLAVENKNKTWRIGLFWGFGHLAGMLLIGILMTIFRDIIPVDKISGHSEQLVGFILIIIGLWSFYRIKNNPKNQHQHPHTHNDDEVVVHIHKHSHGESAKHSHPHHEIAKKQGLWAAFSVGTLHGLAGVAHFILFLPTLTFESNYDSALYIIGFAIGTILSMSVFSLILGKIAVKTELSHNDRLFNGIRFGVGIFAIVIGFYWIISTI